MLGLFIYIMKAAVVLWSIISLGGYVLYKCEFDSAKTWEDGIKLMTLGVFNFLYDFLSDKPRPETIVNTGLCLQNKEMINILKLFQNHPYETPTLMGYNPNDNGVMRFEISALGLMGKYDDMTNDMIREMCYNIIQNYFMETRECMVEVYIIVATPQYLSVAIPLSGTGRKILMKQQEVITQQEKTANSDELEEEINLFEE